jgi:hypothetical protein
MRGSHQERDYNTQEKDTIYSCWAYDYGYEKEMAERGRTIPEEVGTEGYPEFPDWCPLPPVVNEQVIDLTKSEINHILVSMNYGCPSLHTAFVHTEMTEPCLKIKEKLKRYSEDKNGD